MEISALTRSVVKRSHAIVSPDGYVNSRVPGWENCTVHVLINQLMGADLCQTLVTLNKNGRLTGKTEASQLFVYLIRGHCELAAGEEIRALRSGQFAYIPIGKEYQISTLEVGTQILTFHKAYQKLDGHDVPPILYGDVANIAGTVYLEDTSIRLQVLLPDTLSFDMAVNIFTYDPGGHLPFVETHVMEHGLIFLQGQGIYRLDQDWYPVKKGDSIWMGPYCQQWFTAMGKYPTVYIYYKNINRFPMAV